MRKAQSATPANQPQISSKTVASTTCNFGVCSKHLPRLAQSSLAEDLSSSVVKSSDFVDGFGLCRVAAAFAWGQDLLRYMADQADEEYLQATILLNFPVVRIGACTRCVSSFHWTLFVRRALSVNLAPLPPRHIPPRDFFHLRV